MLKVMAGESPSTLPRGVFTTVINNQANIRIPAGSQKTQTVHSSQTTASVSHDHNNFIII